MFQEDSFEELILQERGTLHETDKQRNERIRKNKNIRKEKVSIKRNQILQMDSHDRKQLTRQQKKQVQKQKNRIAAQNSRDKQKKYLEDLEAKVNEMQKQLQSQLCRKCKATLSEHSTSQGEHHEQSQSLHYQPSSGASTLEVQVENSQINVLGQERSYEDLPFFRDDSKSDVEWGNIGKYFCIVLIVFSIALLSNSVEFGQSGSMGRTKQVARILTQNHEVCQPCSSNLPVHSKKIENLNKGVISTSQLPNQQYRDWPFKADTQEGQEKCKNDFWEHYLGKVKNQIANPYDWNLVTCNSPNLVHVSTVYERSINHIQDKWTFLITNPIVSQVLIDKSAGVNYHLDEVNYLDGVYQLTAQKVTFTKVIQDSCLK